jgi:hypothetical protein
VVDAGAARRCASDALWTERCSEFVRPQALLTERVRVWATDRVAALEAAPASLAPDLGTTWSVIERHGQRRVDAAGRDGPVAQNSCDETVVSPTLLRRRRRSVTSAVDVANGQVIEIPDGRNPVDLRR